MSDQDNDGFERRNNGRVGIGPDVDKGQVRSLTGVLNAILPAEKAGDNYYQFIGEGGVVVEVFDNKALKDNLTSDVIGKLIKLDFVKMGTTKAGKSFKEIAVSVCKTPNAAQIAKYPALQGDAIEETSPAGAALPA